MTISLAEGQSLLSREHCQKSLAGSRACHLDDHPEVCYPPLVRSVTSIDSIRLPGPPAEKEPPPPSRNCSTVTAVLPFTSFQPPGYSNASIACVMGDGLNCLQETHFCHTAAISTACDLPITSSSTWHSRQAWSAGVEGARIWQMYARMHIFRRWGSEGSLT